jgi:outer membrane protein OmpA-like peptidoglycan-associated protein
MSRINIVIIGVIGSIFLIFSCISFHGETYYFELNPERVQASTKRLNPKPTIPLKNREKKRVDIQTIEPTCSETFLKNKIAILFKKKEEKKHQTIDKRHRIYIDSDNNNSLLNETQIKISTLLQKEQITFQKNRKTVNEDGKKVLDKIFTLIDFKHQKYSIEIQGHTDAGGKRKINQWISKNRADEVKRYLVNKGIPAKKIKTEGFGESRLLFIDKPYSKKNRRVEIYIKRK